MAVYKRGKIWWYKFNWNGDPIRESTKQSNKRIAEQMEAARKTALAKGEVGIKRKERAPKLAEFASRFTAAIETTCAEKPATVAFYKAKLKVLVKHLGSRRLDEIEEAKIEQYTQMRANTKSRRKQPLSPASVNRELATLRRLLRLAQEWKILDRVPRIHLLRGEHQREFTFNRQQEKLYFEMAEPYGDLRDVAAVLIDTGLRIRECLTLEWPEVRLEPAEGAEHGYMTVRRKHAKNSKSRNVPLTARVVEVLSRRAPAARGLVFRRADGQPLYQTWLNQQHADLRALLKMPADCVLHSFRHTFGTRLGETGADAFTIMKLMGHSTVTVSQRYVHPSPEAMERAVSRMEAYNTAGVYGVGTNLGTAVGADSADKVQVV
ncbi:MAG: site-specific integrase [Bryobacteraceae bacterium]|jgi:integrase